MCLGLDAGQPLTNSSPETRLILHFLKYFQHILLFNTRTYQANTEAHGCSTKNPI